MKIKKEKKSKAQHAKERTELFEFVFPFVENKLNHILEIEQTSRSKLLNNLALRERHNIPFGYSYYYELLAISNGAENTCVGAQALLSIMHFAEISTHCAIAGYGAFDLYSLFDH